MRVEYWFGSFDKLCLKRKRDMKNTITIACASLSLAVTTFETQADFTQPGFLFRLFEGGLASGGEACNFGSVTQVAANEWFFQGQHSNTIGTSMSWAYLVDPDPFITGTLSLTNETAFSKEYVVDFSLPISPAIAQSTVSGQMSGTLTDSNGSGSASLTSTNGGAIYTALADDMFVQSLMSNANQIVTSPFGTNSFSGGSFGQGLPPLAGPSINSTIGIRYSFTLSAGDSVSFSSIFVALPVPAPGVIAMGILAGFTARRGRRRSA